MTDLINPDDPTADVTGLPDPTDDEIVEVISRHAPTSSEVRRTLRIIAECSGLSDEQVRRIYSACLDGSL